MLVVGASINKLVRPIGVCWTVGARWVVVGRCKLVVVARGLCAVPYGKLRQLTSRPILSWRIALLSLSQILGLILLFHHDINLSGDITILLPITPPFTHASYLRGRHVRRYWNSPSEYPKFRHRSLILIFRTQEPERKRFVERFFEGNM
jgi:hypothetical protein